jgi:mono/diheme cytochrome c family protein
VVCKAVITIIRRTCGNTNCDTTTVTFNVTVHPIIKTNCESCHSGSSAGGGVQLVSYDDIKASAASGRLMGTIRHEQGYSAMPKGGNKLSDCDIAKLDKWIAESMKNN